MNGPQVIEVLGGRSTERPLTVRFQWTGDRYQHQIGVQRGAQFVPLLSSIEGDASEPWPLSPPLQQLSVEERDEGRHVALLVGMAGKSHWSASVDLDGTGETAEFDLACLAKGTPRRTGSTYRLLEPAVLDSPTRLQVGPLLIAAEAKIELQADQATIGPLGIPEKTGHLRWRFSIHRQ